MGEQAAAVPRRRWGRSGLSIPVIPFGTQGFGDLFGPVAEEEATHLVRRAIELGVNHFDCARCYGNSLAKLRGALQGLPRESVIVSGRVCLHRDRGDALHPDRPRHADNWLPDARADAVVRDVEEQLHFLGMTTSTRCCSTTRRTWNVAWRPAARSTARSS